MYAPRPVRWVVATLFTIGVYTVFYGNVLAIEYGGFGGRPAYPRPDNPRTESIFVHTLQPGEKQEEGVLVVNNTTERKTVLVYAADSTPSTGGAFACKQFGETSNDVGAWISLAQSEVALDPGTNRIIPFVIRVPKNVSVGEHNGCILIQEKKVKTEGQGMSLSVRTGLRVAVTIPGEIKRKLEIAGFTVTRQPDTGVFVLRPVVRNTGNVSIDADIQVVTSHWFGIQLAEHGGEYPILRGETSDWNFELRKPFWGGWYRSSLVVAYDENPEAGVGVKSGKTLTRLEISSIWFWSAPAPLALAIEIFILLVLVFCGFLLWLWRKRKQWINAHWVFYEVRPGEDIQSLAARFGVSWKLLAKVNNIKPPFTTNAGDKIKIPPNK